MRKPTQMETFDTLYALAAQNGREEALFGTSIELARPVYEKSLIGDSYPIAYLEFPLLGEPCFDLLTVHANIPEGARFAEGAGFGYQPMYDWFSSLSETDSVSCGIELDTGSGETERAGAYMQYRKHDELIAPFLESIGESSRLDSYLAVKKRLPEGWDPAYVGLFPGRPGTPMRIGGYLSGKEVKACAQDCACLRDRLDRAGYSAYTPEMLERCRTFMELAPSIDYQFDIMADGSLGPTFGLSLSFNETKPRDARECMENGYGARIMEQLETWGLADDRWKLIADAAFARHIPVENEDGSEERFALCVLFNYAKVKFTDGVASPAKFYFVLKSGVVE